MLRAASGKFSGKRIVFHQTPFAAVIDSDDNRFVSFRAQCFHRLIDAPIVARVRRCLVKQILSVVHIHHRITFFTCGVRRRQINQNIAFGFKLRNPCLRHNAHITGNRMRAPVAFYKIAVRYNFGGLERHTESETWCA